MKFKKTLPLIALLLLIPMVGFAFSWKSFVWWDKPEVKVETKQELNQKEKLSAETKFKNWDTAFQKKSWNSLIKNEENFSITETEANYMATKKITEEKNPIIKNLKIKFQDDEIICTGYLLKPLKGEIKVHFEPIIKNNKLEIKLTKARYKKIPFPKSIANKILGNALKPIEDFLYSYPNYKGLEIESKNKILKLNFK